MVQISSAEHKAHNYFSDFHRIDFEDIISLFLKSGVRVTSGAWSLPVHMGDTQTPISLDSWPCVTVGSGGPAGAEPLSSSALSWLQRKPRTKQEKKGRANGVSSVPVPIVPAAGGGGGGFCLGTISVGGISLMKNIGTPPILVQGHQTRETSTQKCGPFCTRTSLTYILNDDQFLTPKRAR